VFTVACPMPPSPTMCSRRYSVLAAARSTLAASSEKPASKLAAVLAGAPVMAFYMKTATSPHSFSIPWKSFIVSSTFLMWRNFK
jgi:hypothetical protein